MANVDLYTASEIDADAVAEIGVDHSFVATGAHWMRNGLGRTHFEPIEGFDQASLSVNAIIAGTQPDGPVVVYDDEHYYMGNVIAAHFARLGNEVTLVTPQP